jgi:adenylosuccinate synthase
MPATIVLGGQWGDEGKGKLTDTLAASAQMVVRANGGSNAGHTVVVGAETYKFHLIPSGILNPGCVCVIAAGTVVNPEALLLELDELEARGIDLSNLRISDRAHLLLPYHPIIDREEEARREEEGIGTTLTGNGPAYADKVARHGIRMADLTDDRVLRRKLLREIDAKNQLLAAVYRQPVLDYDKTLEMLQRCAERIRPMVSPTEELVQDALSAGSEVVLECAQGAMLDIDYGTYPYVTSSSPTAAGACQAAGVAPSQVRRVLAVYKAYSTRVGSGPMPTELTDDTGKTIRERGKEYGTTTGRPRRTGWFDAVAGRRVARLNGVTEIALTLLDVLDVFPVIQIGLAYNIEGDQVRHLPAREDLLALADPVYETVPGWEASTSEARTGADLPAGARAYIESIEHHVGAPVTMVGVGPGREQLVSLEGAAVR